MDASPADTSPAAGSLKPAAISTLTGVNRMTIVEVLIAFKRNGTHESQRSKKQQPPWPIPEEVTEFLLNNLHEHRFLTLDQRRELVRRQFGFSMNR